MNSKRTNGKSVARPLSSNEKWSAVWNTKGAHRIAMETARQKLRNPLYTTYFGENGNFRKAGNTNAIRKQRIATQRQLVNTTLHVLRSVQPRKGRNEFNYNPKKATSNTMQVNKWNATWNESSPARRAKKTANRMMRNPAYVISREEIGNFKRKSNNNAGIKRKQRVATQLRLIARELDVLETQYQTFRRMQRAGATGVMPKY